VEDDDDDDDDDDDGDAGDIVGGIDWNIPSARPNSNDSEQ